MLFEKCLNSIIGILGNICAINSFFCRWKLIKIITYMIVYLLKYFTFLKSQSWDRKFSVFKNIVLCLFFHLFFSRRKVEIMHTHSLFTLLGERLMLHTNTVTVTTYNTLYEVKILKCVMSFLNVWSG